MERQKIKLSGAQNRKREREKDFVGIKKAFQSGDQDLSHVVDDEAYDYKFVKWMIKEKKLAAIPVAAFVGDESKKQFEKYIRFCFIKQDLEKLEEDLTG